MNYHLGNVEIFHTIPLAIPIPTYPVLPSHEVTEPLRNPNPPHELVPIHFNVDQSQSTQQSCSQGFKYTDAISLGHNDKHSFTPRRRAWDFTELDICEQRLKTSPLSEPRPSNHIPDTFPSADPELSASLRERRYFQQDSWKPFYIRSGQLSWIFQLLVLPKYLGREASLRLSKVKARVILTRWSFLGRRMPSNTYKVGQVLK